MSERLYSLLPAVYRVRDAAQGEPLRALLQVLETETNRLEADIAGLYDDWFIETCADWVIPYIGDLLAARPLHPTGPGSLRAYVANTLAYRRRKGTAAVLEQLARDVTGWPAHAVEFFELLGTTQHVNHVRLANHRTPDLRDANRLELVDGPFERATHTAEVRRIATEGGRYHIPNVGLFLWRLQSFAVERGQARKFSAPGTGAFRGFTFHPLGLDAPLFNRPRTERTISHLAEEHNVPGPLRRRPLFDELEARRQALAEGVEPDEIYFGAEPVLRVWLQPAPGDPLTELTPEEITVCHLAEWCKPEPASPPFKRKRDNSQYNLRVAVDPVLGRLTFPAGVEPTLVLVSYSYGFSSDVGAGPYPRLVPTLRPVTWQVGVSRDQPAIAGERIFTEFTDAVRAWNDESVEGTVGVIVLMDSRTCAASSPQAAQITVKPESQLLVIGADWPVIFSPDPAVPPARRVGQFLPEGVRPHLRGDLTVQGVAADNPGELLLEGVLLEGKLTVAAKDNAVPNSGNLGSLRLAHCTLAPANGGLAVPKDNSRLVVSVARCITGPVTLDALVPNVQIAESIVDGPLAASATAAELRAVTLLATTNVRRLEASGCLFVDALTVTLRQEGCVRFSFVPAGISTTPRRYRCQPDLALEQRALELAKEHNLEEAPPLPPAEAALLKGRVRPVFTSTALAHPGDAQLSLVCAEEIRTGAEDGTEMGVFAHLCQPQRATNLRVCLQDYLRFGLEAGLFYVT